MMLKYAFGKNYERNRFRKNPIPHRKDIQSTRDVDLSTQMAHVPNLNRLTDEFFIPFSWKNKEIRDNFQIWADDTQKTGETLEDYLWKHFRIQAIDRESNSMLIKDAASHWEVSVKRHIALFYQRYLQLGGDEKRQFGLPVCYTIGINLFNQDEKRTKTLDRLAGSQAFLTKQSFQYAQNTPFTFKSDGVVSIISKHYRHNKNSSVSSSKNSENHDLGPDSEYMEEALRIYGREIYAHSLVNNVNVIQPVCFERSPEPVLVMPLLMGGDLVPLSSDVISLNPDSSFLPHFAYHLINAIYSVHQQGLIHLDLKPENLVVSGPDRLFYKLNATHESFKSPMGYRLTLLDFGMSMPLDKVSEEAYSCVRYGTDVTMAPEQFMCNAPTGRGTDWWGFGASLWRTRIFWEPTLSDVERDSLLNFKCEQWGHHSLPIQPFFSPELQSLLKMLLVPSPKDRDFSVSPEAFSKLLKHPYFDVARV